MGIVAKWSRVLARSHLDWTAPSSNPSQEDGELSLFSSINTYMKVLMHLIIIKISQVLVQTCITVTLNVSHQPTQTLNGHLNHVKDWTKWKKILSCNLFSFCTVIWGFDTLQYFIILYFAKYHSVNYLLFVSFCSILLKNIFAENTIFETVCTFAILGQNFNKHFFPSLIQGLNLI